MFLFMARKRKEEEVEIVPDKVFKVKLALKSGVPGVDAYIQETTEHFLEFNISTLQRIVTTLSDYSLHVVNSLFHIASADDQSIPTLSEEKTEEVFGKLMTVVSNAKEVFKLCEEAKTIIDEVEGKVEEVRSESTQQEPTPQAKNIFEELQKKRRKV